MRTIIQSLTMHNETATFYKEDESMYIVQLRLNDEIMTEAMFPTSMFREAGEFYRKIAEDIIIGQDEGTVPGTDGGLH